MGEREIVRTGASWALGIGRIPASSDVLVDPVVTASRRAGRVCRVLPARACDPSINVAVLQRSRDGDAVAAVDDVIAVRLSAQENWR